LFSDSLGIELIVQVPVNQNQFVRFLLPEAVVIAKEIHIAVAGGVCKSEIIKTKPFFLQITP